jgi:diguanylate cyclase (GGDEF)-like protein
MAIVVAMGGLAIRWKTEVQVIEIRRMRRIEVERATQLHETNAQLSRISTVDALTDVYNRRFLDELARRWSTPIVPAPPHGVLMIDVDHFKLFNDHSGHAEGDRCLGRIAGALKLAVRLPDDIVVRYGGEEFAVVLEGLGMAETLVVAERVRLAVSELRIPHPGLALGNFVSVSIGASASPPAGNLVETIGRADQMLYAAKRNGRNRIDA